MRGIKAEMTKHIRASECPSSRKSGEGRREQARLCFYANGYIKKSPDKIKTNKEKTKCKSTL